MVLLLGWLLLTGGVAILAGSLGYLGARRRDADHRRRVQALLSQPLPPVVLPACPPGDMTSVWRGPVKIFIEGVALVADLAAGETAFCRYRASEGVWRITAPPPGVDGETGERLAVAPPAGPRADGECRTWGLYARVR
jgi:hypothetical protein